MPSARNIEILAFADAQVLDISGPLQVFSSANDFAAARSAPAPYRLTIVGMSSQIRTSSGLVLAAEPLPEHCRHLDTLVIPGGWGVNAACEDPELVEWVGQSSAQARRTVSVCSGAFLLATTGVLNGRRAVTHWQRCAEFSQRFPDVRLEPDPIFIRDGAIWTSAGVTAGIDLALALVEADLGREAALAVARQLVVFFKRPGGQSQFSATLALQESATRFDRLHAWILDNLRSDLSLIRLAEQANMSARSFCRHYLSETGLTPARGVEQIRFETARRMLEQGNSVGRVAAHCGFGSDETMRRCFLRYVGITPQAYRERF
ncbi:GlxA family transcriptional regulator [Phyllobacterium sp. UNC302MFCol5.2]|uniref:GlxA family transcriptional regulator n=1 Tax=Phyllobacterium sp. UNC302MFCol5.2 TaxID=1449065 RepID=UPI0009E05DD7|nr:GlxA family transcriptional regulator [Phyllobacterium sp. UNC302MFCol5.2]